ncbi:MAG: molybdenum ABC transporter ATP-binding protein [Pseudomonadota bacterium]|nr:molybdenum ABC transporter ATP-binding protein [Pseudomonadota bacterium]
MASMLDVSVTRKLGGFAIDAQFSAGLGVTSLFGRSGAGKTSIVNMIAGLLRPDRGRIAAGGRVLFDSTERISLPPHKRRVGYVFQDGRLFPHLTVRQNLNYGRWFTQAADRSTDFDMVADMLDLAPLMTRFPATLSGGEKQRVAIGRALLSSPRMLLMDEPLASLDDHRKQEILPYIERLRDGTDMPIVHVSHSLGEVARLASTLVLVSAGKVEASGPTEEIMARTDLFPLTGRFEAGALIDCTVDGRDRESGLLKLKSRAGMLLAAASDIPDGTALKVRIRARDVMIATSKPIGFSALNVLPATVSDIRSDPPYADIRLDAGGTVLLARITDHSVRKLGLRKGRQVFAVIKSTSFDRRSLGVAKE